MPPRRRRRRPCIRPLARRRKARERSRTRPLPGSRTTLTNIRIARTVVIHSSATTDEHPALNPDIPVPHQNSDVLAADHEWPHEQCQLLAALVIVRACDSGDLLRHSGGNIQGLAEALLSRTAIPLR